MQIPHITVFSSFIRGKKNNLQSCNTFKLLIEQKLFEHFYIFHFMYTMK